MRDISRYYLFLPESYDNKNIEVLPGITPSDGCERGKRSRPKSIKYFYNNNKMNKQ